MTITNNSIFNRRLSASTVTSPDNSDSDNESDISNISGSPKSEHEEAQPWKPESMGGGLFRHTIGRISALASAVILLTISLPVQFFKTLGKTFTPYVPLKGHTYSEEIPTEWKVTASCFVEAFKHLGRFFAAPPKGYSPCHKEITFFQKTVICGRHLEPRYNGKCISTLFAEGRNGAVYKWDENIEAKKSNIEDLKKSEEIKTQIIQNIL